MTEKMSLKETLSDFMDNCQYSGCKYARSCYKIMADNLIFNEKNKGKQKRDFRCPILCINIKE